MLLNGQKLIERLQVETKNVRLFRIICEKAVPAIVGGYGDRWVIIRAALRLRFNVP